MESGPTPNEPVPKAGEIVLYRTEDGRTRVECRFVDETLWLSQALIGELFQKDVRTINEHLQNIYAEGELDEGATIRKFRIVRREGMRDVEREIEHYNLDAILAVGYRDRALQSRCHPGRGVPCEIGTRHAVSPLGDRAVARVSGEGLHQIGRASRR